MKNRILILTSVPRGIASQCLSALVESSKIEIVSIILSKGAPKNKFREIRRKVGKTFQIGLLGALNGVRIRKWFSYGGVEDIADLARRYNIPLNIVETINSEETVRCMKKASANLGLSLGNGYIAKSVFTVPSKGMINIHSELLPRFQGAQSIIWPIYEGIKETGFTIHRIDSNIDTGDILFQKKYKIIFYPRLKETVKKNLEIIRRDIPSAFVYACENYEELLSNRIKQEKGHSYTTPSFMQYLRMERNNRKLYYQQRNQI